jgi:hypothetical protein
MSDDPQTYDFVQPPRTGGEARARLCPFKVSTYCMVNGCMAWMTLSDTEEIADKPISHIEVTDNDGNGQQIQKKMNITNTWKEIEIDGTIKYERRLRWQELVGICMRLEKNNG